MEPQEYAPSPVPRDARLWPGELPFTAWGQFGEDRLDLRVFDQATYWVDRHGAPHLLEAMTDLYRRNVITFLEANAEHFHADSIRRELLQIFGDAMLGGHAGAARALTDAGPALTARIATEWLEGTPLMRRLRQLTASRSPGEHGPEAQ